MTELEFLTRIREILHQMVSLSFCYPKKVLGTLSSAELVALCEEVDRRLFKFSKK